MDQNAMPVFRCPLCGLDAPHKVSGELHEVYGIRCSNCGNGSLVRSDDLTLYQMRWEEELRDILESLDYPKE